MVLQRNGSWPGFDKKILSPTLDLFLMDFLELVQELCKTLCGHVQGCVQCEDVLLLQIIQVSA